MRFARCCLVAAMGALPLAGARPAAAQRLSGTVRDRVSGQPVPGAVLWLSDSLGSSLARAIGDPVGHYSVQRVSRARELHVVRIGFQPLDMPLMGAGDVLDIVLDAVPMQLAPMYTSAQRVCGNSQKAEAGL